MPIPGSWTGRCMLGVQGGIAIRAIVDERGANFFESADARRGNILDPIAQEFVTLMRLLTLSRRRLYAGLALGIAAVVTAAMAAGQELMVLSRGTTQILEYDANSGSYIGIFAETVTEGFRLPGGLVLRPTDGLIIVENESEYQSVVPASNLTVGIVNEIGNTHCGFTEAEITGGWLALQGWVAGQPQPTATDLQDTCLFAEFFLGAGGPCRIDPSFVIPDMDGRIPPR
ncbi:MAG: hypothetical protein IH885_03725 [Myxococcales bacterium]|nr:hypothetical protein [Myxococcales bacterium]